MPRDFIPRRDVDFLGFSANFAQKIRPPTDPATLGLTSSQVAQYIGVQQAFTEAYRLANTPGTRTSPVVMTKNTARDVPVRETRVLANIIRSHPGVTDTMLVDLRLLPPSKGERRRRVPAPAVSPRLWASQTMPGRFEIKLRDAETGRFRKPADVRGAIIMAYAGSAGDKPPVDPRQWTLLAQTTRTKLTVTVAMQAGETLWLTACWTGTRDERGPWCTAFSTRINFGGLLDPKSASIGGSAPLHDSALPLFQGAGRDAQELKQAA